MSSPNEAQVVQCDGVIYLVNLATSHCGCGRYAENGVPCSHAMAFIYDKAESLDAYLPDALKMETQIAAYREAMPPISIAGLKPAMDDDADSDDEGFGRACNPPLTRVPRGRPRKQRLDKGNYRATRGVGAADLADRGDGQREKRTVICGTCGEEGHYCTTCRRAHN
jgi:SWIM zinc finger